MTGYEQFKQIMAEMNYKIQMEENRKNGKISDLPPGFDQIFNQFK